MVKGSKPRRIKQTKQSFLEENCEFQGADNLRAHFEPKLIKVIVLIIFQIFFVTRVFFKTGEYLMDMFTILGHIQSRMVSAYKILHLFIPRKAPERSVIRHLV